MDQRIIFQEKEKIYFQILEKILIFVDNFSNYKDPNFEYKATLQQSIEKLLNVVNLGFLTYHFYDKLYNLYEKIINLKQKQNKNIEILDDLYFNIRYLVEHFLFLVESEYLS
jgi:hypothetical protein